MGRINSRVDEILVPVIPRAVPSPPPSPRMLSPTTMYGELRTKESASNYHVQPRGQGCHLMGSRDALSDRLFDEGYRADVKIYTGRGIVYAHSNILGTASPVLQGMLKESKRQGCYRILAVRGVPHDAVLVFIRFLYTSGYEEKDMEEFVLHILLLSHSYCVPQLKRNCKDNLERGMINLDNVIGIVQLTLLCDASRLGLICHHMITRNLKDVSATEGWKAMKNSHPVLEKVLEKVLVEYLIEENNLRKERTWKANERKMYLQLYEAMEALVHICRDGCRTIGPHDKALRRDHLPCSFEACRGLELLVPHFASCKLRSLGGCIHCRRMWQVLELHSRLCADPDSCRVPLCRNSRDRIRKHNNKKDEKRWKILTRKILRSESTGGGPFFTASVDSS